MNFLTYPDYLKLKPTRDQQPKQTHIQEIETVIKSHHSDQKCPCSDGFTAELP